VWAESKDEGVAVLGFVLFGSGGDGRDEDAMSAREIAAVKVSTTRSVAWR